MEHRMGGCREYEEGDCHRHGFKMFLPLLAVPLVFGMMRGFTRHHYGRGYMHGHPGGERDENFVPPFFAEMHRRAHAAEAKAAAETKTATQQPPVAES